MKYHLDSVVDALLDDQSTRETLKEFAAGELTPAGLFYQLSVIRQNHGERKDHPEVECMDEVAV